MQRNRKPFVKFFFPEILTGTHLCVCLLCSKWMGDSTALPNINMLCVSVCTHTHAHVLSCTRNTCNTHTHTHTHTHYSEDLLPRSCL
jgi:hypothetical protein